MDVPRLGSEDEADPQDVDIELVPDYDDPRIAPLDPNDRLANARRIDWDEPMYMRPQARRRQATAEEVRRMQFETARRIIFGTRNVHGTSLVTGEPLHGKEPREAWTTAGFVRGNEVTYHTPFQLGSVTLMITPGLNGRETPQRVPLPELNVPRPIEVVWMQMAGPVIKYNAVGAHSVYRTRTTDKLAGLWINYQWVCIGYLRADDFLPIMPNFVELMWLDMGYHDEWGRDPNSSGNEGDRHEKFWADPLGPSKDGRLRGYRRGIMVGVRKCEPSGTRKLTQSIQGDWCQLVPGSILRGMLRPASSTIVEDVLVFKGVGHRDAFIVPSANPYAPTWEWTRDNGKYGNYRFGRDDFDLGWELEYDPIIPVDEADSMFDVVVPEEFLARMGPRVEGPCGFLREYHTEGTQTREEPHFTAWKYEDVAAVIYAQSWLMHVLTGPDRRRYEEVREGALARSVKDAKETQEPEPCFRLARSAAASGMFCIELLGTGHVAFVSGGTSLRFFNPSLALRAARAMQQGYAETAGVVLRTYPDDGSYVFARLLARENRDRLARELAAMQIPLDRFREYEFLGCNVCTTKPAEFYAHKLGLHVCSVECHERAKVEGWACTVDEDGKATVRAQASPSSGWKLVVGKTGGIAGIEEETTVYEDGTVTYSGKNAGCRVVKRIGAQGAEKLRKWAHGVKEVPPPSGVDMISLWVTLYDEQDRRIVHKEIGRVPPALGIDAPLRIEYPREGGSAGWKLVYQETGGIVARVTNYYVFDNAVGFRNAGSVTEDYSHPIHMIGDPRVLHAWILCVPAMSDHPPVPDEQYFSLRLYDRQGRLVLKKRISPVDKHLQLHLLDWQAQVPTTDVRADGDIVPDPRGWSLVKQERGGFAGINRTTTIYAVGEAEVLNLKLRDALPKSLPFVRYPERAFWNAVRAENVPPPEGNDVLSVFAIIYDDRGRIRMQDKRVGGWPQ